MGPGPRQSALEAALQARGSAAVFDFVPQDQIPPDEDQAILQKVWIQIKELHSARPLPKTLYHYTDAAGLKGIVESGVLRATHISFMNDASEYLHAVSLLSDCLREAKKRVTYALQRALIEEMETPVFLTRPEHAAPYFITCFSAQENSLNQWRAYGRGEGGFSIGFDAAKIDAKCRDLFFFISPAIYDSDEQVKLVRDFLSWALDEYVRVAAQHPETDRDKHRRAWAHTMLWRLTAAAPIMKNPAFGEEQEWRLIHMLQTKWDVRFLTKPSGLVPFVELKLGTPQPPSDHIAARLGRPLPDLLPITELWSGPGRATDTSLLAGRTLLEQFNYDGVKLNASKIPYRVA
jgi:hypothetical protein